MGECEALAHVFISGFVPFMFMKYPGDFMGNGRVLLSGGLAPSKEFGVILWDGRSPFVVVVVVVVVLFCFSNPTK